MTTTIRLAVPYISQLDEKADYGLGDSGIANVTALIHALTPERPTVDDVARQVNLPAGFTGTTVRHVQQAAAAFGVTLTTTTKVTRLLLEKELGQQHPIILLVYYPRLPDRYDPGYSFGHFVLLHGMDEDHFYYDDPFYPNALGADRRIAKDTLMQAVYAYATSSNGNPHALICRSQQLPTYDPNSRDGSAHDITRTVSLGGFTLSGTVLDSHSTPLPTASVRLIGARDPLGQVPGAVAAPMQGEVLWDSMLTGWSGNRWGCWETHVKHQTGLSFDRFSSEVLVRNPVLATDGFVFVKEKTYTLPRLASVVAWCKPVTGISGTRWEVFQSQVETQVRGIGAPGFIADALRYNPTLEKDGAVFKANKVYRFPDNLWGGTEIRWTRPLNGFMGNRNDAWHRFVNGQVQGLTATEFYHEAERWNPTLATEDGHVFRKNKHYLLPENAPATLYYLLTWTDAQGRYRLDHLPAGLYTLEIEVAGQMRQRQSITIDATSTCDVKLAAHVPKEIIPPPPSDTVPPKGFIYVRDGQFMREKRPYRFVGVNFRSIAHFGNRHKFLTAEASPNRRVEFFREAQRMGVKVIRLFLASRNADTPTTIKRLRDVVNLLGAEGRDMYVIVAFADVHNDTDHNLAADTQYYSDDAQNKLGFNFYERDYKNHYLPFVKEVVRAFKDEPRIFAWELGNEFKPMKNKTPTPDTAQQFITFAHAVSAEIRALAPHHMITTGIINTFSLACTTDQAKQLYDGPHLDFHTIHVYDGGHSNSDVAKWQPAEIHNMQREIGVARQHTHKPYIVEEIGFYGNQRAALTQHYCNDLFQHKQCSGVMQWAFNPYTDRLGDEDAAFGQDRINHRDDYDAIFNVYRDWASRLG